MGLDPVSIVLTAVLLWHLFTNGPRVLGELASDLAAALRERSLRAAFREQIRRIRKAGMAPGRGYLRNLWRANATAANRRRQDARAGRAEAGRDRGLRGRLDRAAAAMVDRWRRANPAPRPRPPVRASATVTRPGPAAPPPPAVEAPAPAVLPAAPPATETNEPAPAYTGGEATVWVLPTTRSAPDSGRRADADEGPVRATATVGSPTTSPGAAVAVLDAPPRRQIEGAPAMSTGTEVTGVVSGAFEAARIAAAVETANEAYLAAMTAIRQQIAALQEATHANVEMQESGEVQTALSQASDAAAAAQAAARNCGAEVGPLMYQVKTAFDRRNS